MSTELLARQGEESVFSGGISRSRKVRDALATAAIYSSVALAAIPLGFLMYYLFKQGGKVVNFAFLTEDIPISSRRDGPGMGPAIIGTLLITGAASLMAIPLGILGAVYLNEYGKSNRLAGFIRFLADVMSGVPSIMMGLFIYTVWVLTFRQSGFAGALALASLMLPIVIRSAENALQLVPDDLRLASAALGTRTSRTTLTIIIPAALPGIVSGALLAIARAAGETAPLVTTIGITNTVNRNLFTGTNTSLSVQIFRNAQLPFAGAQDRAWGAALTLIVSVFVLTGVARLISTRFTVR